ncbi:hypothetical protein A2159_01090 [Candidatus Woesebacteria bacterium RBG_13_34_9]|uniref:Transcriptional regulator n=1 Tax=Candidatus Woesebacteria bacterium RBG_13_34_9 TaxID=1802477 RepID=A0A1F7X6F6_9BACT|nr:MAG: hypothetical protein A2159_01090 [Candidatus Woesebacteria bacterium RBG_13_34_9]
MSRGIPKDKSVKRKIIHRFKIAKGHLEKVISMIEKDEYCINIVHQSLAVQSALKEIDKIIIKNHLETCVSDAIKKGDNQEVIDELMKVLDKK